jgi:conjugative relaxase-like TrwC/TraI family protein
VHVSVGKVRRGAKGRAYYLKLAREAGALDGAGAYYLKDDPLEGAGRWFGRLAAGFGLSGAVGREDFAALHDGYTPAGEPLSKNVSHPGRRPAFDLTHSLVKDASILASLSDSWRGRIFDEVAGPAVGASLAYLERDACWTRRGRAGAEVVPGEGLVGAMFQHMAARSVDGQAVDPQAHVHCVIFNTTQGPDGILRTLDGDALYRRARAAAALASVEESYRLEQLGFTLVRDGGRSFKISGIPDALREENSKRSRQIREHAGEDATAKERDRANWETREPKEAVDVPALLDDWRRRNERHGLTEDVVDRLRRGRPRERDVARELGEALGRALKQIGLNESTFTEQTLLELTALESQCRGVRASDVRLHVWAELERASRGLPTRHELIYRGVDEDGRRRFCTRELLELEAGLLREAAASRGERGRVAPAQVERAVAGKGTLSPDQARAVRGLCLKPGRIQCLLGGAGTGKTFALDAVRAAHEAAGYRCLGTAVANRAARGLGNDAGMEAMNTKKLLYEIDRGRLSLDGACLFLDEAATVDTREFARLSAAVHRAKNGRLIVIGDHRQHAAVGPGGVFAGLCARLGFEELTEIIRQRQPVDKEMVAAFRDRNIHEAVRGLAGRGRLHVGEEVSDSQESLVEKWGDDRTPLREKRIIASTNNQVDRLNARCQAWRESRGELGGEGVRIKGDFAARVGDRVILRKSFARLDVSNGDVGTVVAVTPTRDELRVRLDDGSRLVTIPLATYGRENVHLGYCATSFLSQGASYDSVYLFVHGNMTDAQAGYVMSSRHRDSCVMHTTRDDAGPGLAKLVRDFSRDRSKRMAHDAAGPTPDGGRSRERERYDYSR